MALGLVGRKIGMTRLFSENGEGTPVTVLEVTANRVTQVKDEAKDGYRAVQVTIGSRRADRLTKAQAGKYASNQVNGTERLGNERCAGEHSLPLTGGVTGYDQERNATLQECRGDGFGTCAVEVGIENGGRASAAFEQLHGLGHVSRHADNFAAGLLQSGGGAGGNQILVLDDQDTHGPTILFSHLGTANFYFSKLFDSAHFCF